MRNSLSCPISVNRVDENVTRVASFLIIIVLSAGILLNSAFIIFLLAFDFGQRAFTSGRFSLIRYFARNISFYTGIKHKLTDAARKKFAAGVGMIFCLFIGFFILSGNIMLANILAFILGICALLEGVFAICVGCQFYSWIIIPFYKPQNN